MRKVSQYQVPKQKPKSSSGASSSPNGMSTVNTPGYAASAVPNMAMPQGKPSSPGKQMVPARPTPITPGPETYPLPKEGEPDSMVKMFGVEKVSSDAEGPLADFGQLEEITPENEDSQEWGESTGSPGTMGRHGGRESAQKGEIDKAQNSKRKHNMEPKIAATIMKLAFANYIEKWSAKKDMPDFIKQDRPKKTKDIYRALKREHPEMSAEMKARIAARQGKPGKQKKGPPYKAPLSKSSANRYVAMVDAAMKNAPDLVKGKLSKLRAMAEAGHPGHFIESSLQKIRSSHMPETIGSPNGISLYKKAMLTKSAGVYEELQRAEKAYEMREPESSEELIKLLRRAQQTPRPTTLEQIQEVVKHYGPRISQAARPILEHGGVGLKAGLGTGAALAGLRHLGMDEYENAKELSEEDKNRLAKVLRSERDAEAVAEYQKIISSLTPEELERRKSITKQNVIRAAVGTAIGSSLGSIYRTPLLGGAAGFLMSALTGDNPESERFSNALDEWAEKYRTRSRSGFDIVDRAEIKMRNRRE